MRDEQGDPLVRLPPGQQRHDRGRRHRERRDADPSGEEPGRQTDDERRERRGGDRADLGAFAEGEDPPPERSGGAGHEDGPPGGVGHDGEGHRDHGRADELDEEVVVEQRARADRDGVAEAVAGSEDHGDADRDAEGQDDHLERPRAGRDVVALERVLARTDDGQSGQEEDDARRDDQGRGDLAEEAHPCGLPGDDEGRHGGRDGSADGLREERRDPDLAEPLVNPGDERGGEEAEQDDEPPAPEQSGRPRGEGGAGDGDDPASVGVRRRDDGVESHPGLGHVEGLLAERDDERPQPFEARVVLHPVADDPHHRDRVGVGTAVVGDGDGGVGDVDVDAREAVGAGQQEHRRRDVGSGRSRGEHGHPGPHGEVDDGPGRVPVDVVGGVPERDLVRRGAARAHGPPGALPEGRQRGQGRQRVGGRGGARSPGSVAARHRTTVCRGTPGRQFHLGRAAGREGVATHGLGRGSMAG